MKSQTSGFLKALGIKYPILQSPMAGVSTVELAATITNSGGLGGLALAPLAGDANEIRNYHGRFKELVGAKGNIVNVNFFSHDLPRFDKVKEDRWLGKFAKFYEESGLEFTTRSLERGSVSAKSFIDDDDVVDALVEIKPKIVSFHFGLPNKEVLQKLQANGILIFVSITDIKEMEEVIEAGVDGVVAQGWEAGGHRGNFKANDINDEKLGTEELIDRIIHYIDTNKVDKEPWIIASGGIHDKAGIQKYLDLGIASVQLGTIWLATSQATIAPKLQTLIENSKKVDTIMIPSVSGRNLRAVKTKWLEELSHIKLDEIPDFPLPYGLFKTFAKDVKGSETEPGKVYSALLAGDNYHKSWKGTKDPAEVFKILVDGLKF